MSSTFEGYKVYELRELARKKKIKHYYRMKKLNLIEALVSSKTQEVKSSPPLPPPPTHQESPPRLQNVMCTVDLGCKLDLNCIASNNSNVKYVPLKFNAAIMRLQEPIKFSTLIFSSGKIVLTGMKDEESSLKAAHVVATRIRELGFQTHFLNYRITNIVASADLGFRPRFTNFYNGNRKFTDYEPELFPGLIYRTGVTFLVFKSGKVVITNAKSRQQINKAYVAFEESIRISTLLQGNRGI
jgi:transcription initiation factor TFIID TATA-box-binding protein